MECEPKEYDNDAEQREFNFYHFQDEFIQALEELRFRRQQNKENEHTINKLLQEKHLLERSLEEMEISRSALEDEHEQTVNNIETHFQEKVSAFELERKQHSTLNTRLKEELQTVKAKMHTLKMENANLEKKTNDLEGQLKMQSNIYKTVTTQVEKANHMQQNLLKHVQQLVDSQCLIKKQVKRAIETNRRLELQNSQSKSVEEVTRKNNELLTEKIICLQSQLTQVDNELSPLKHRLEVEKLERQISKLERDIKNANAQLCKFNEENLKMLMALGESSTLSLQYKKQLDKQHEENLQLKQYLQEVKSMENEWHEKCSRLEVALNEYQAKNNKKEKQQNISTQDAFKHDKLLIPQKVEAGDQINSSLVVASHPQANG